MVFQWHFFLFLFLFLFGEMTHILRSSTEHKTASPADEGNSVYCQSSVGRQLKTTEIVGGATQDNVKFTTCFIVLFIIQYKNLKIFILISFWQGSNRKVAILLYKKTNYTIYLYQMYYTTSTLTQLKKCLK